MKGLCMGRRDFLINIIRLALVVAAIGAACFLCSCKSGAENPAPPDELEEMDIGQASAAPETPAAPPTADTEKGPARDIEQSPAEETNTPDTSGIPSAPENTPDVGDGREGTAGDSAEPSLPPVYPEPDKIAYITIDDGPTREVTPAMLDILKAEGIKATFFVLPHSDVEDLYGRILDEGHVIGNHSYSHKYNPLYAADTTFFREDLLAMHEFICNMLGYTPTLYRFPGGTMGRNKATIAVRVEILEELGYTYFDWNSSTGDSDSTGNGKGTQTLVDNVLNKTNGRTQLIVLMHDSRGKQTTVEALPYIIDGLRQQGYAFDTLDNYD